MSYVESVGCAVPNENRGTHEDGEGEIRDAHGAWLDEIPVGELTFFPKAVQCKESESLSVGWHLRPSREAWDAARQ